MNKILFATPKVGDVVTVTTRYRNSYLYSDAEWDDRTYENVPVVENDSWTKPDEFCIPGGHLPHMMKRTISLNNVIALTVNGDASATAAPSKMEFIKMAGSKGNTYVVTTVNGVAKECTCPGFTYRKNCKHLNLATKETA